MGSPFSIWLFVQSVQPRLLPQFLLCKSQLDPLVFHEPAHLLKNGEVTQSDPIIACVFHDPLKIYTSMLVYTYIIEEFKV